MYNVSEQFIKAIKNNARKIKCYFTYKGKIYHPQSVTIDNNIYNEEKDTFIGTFIAKSGVLKLDVSTPIELENQKIEIFMGVLCELDYEYVPIGSFYIYEKTADLEYKIIDSKMLFNIPFDSGKVCYPTTVLLLLQNVCQQSSVELATLDFPNHDLVIDKEIFFGYEPSCYDVIMAISQATCSFAQINRENQLCLKWFNSVDFKMLIDNQLTYPQTLKQYGPINSLVLAREPQNDNVFIQDEVSIEENGLLELKISNNPILDIDRYQSRQAIWNVINGFTYLPATINCQGFFHLDVGDIIEVETSEGVIEDVLVINHSIKFTGGAASKITAPALSKTQIDYAVASSVETKILQTEIKIDKIKGEIVSTVNDLKQTVEKIQIENITVAIEQSQGAITAKKPSVMLNAKVYLNGEDITATIEEISFSWFRLSEDYDSDLEWNNQQAKNKIISINSKDIDLYANFYCMVTTPYGTAKSDYKLVSDETDISNLQVFIDLNQPTYQGFNNGQYSPDWEKTGNLILTPVVMDNYFQIQLSECEITWGKVSGNLDADETDSNGILTVTKNKLTSTIREISYIVTIKYHYSSISKTVTFTNYLNEEQIEIDDRVYYTWVYYANTSDGNGISVNPLDKQYIGVANMQSSKEPPYELDDDGNKIYNDLSAFTWTKMIDYHVVIEQYGQSNDTSVLWLDSDTNQLKKYYTFLKQWAPINDESSIRDAAEEVFLTTEKNSIADFTILNNKITSTIKNVEKIETNFGSQLSEISSDITQTKTDIEFTFSEINKIAEGLEADSEIIQDIKTNFLFNKEGLSIGQSDDNLRMVLNNKELAFFDGSTKVAYISDKRLYIEQVVVVQSLQVGDYILQYDKDIGFILQ